MEENQNTESVADQTASASTPESAPVQESTTKPETESHQESRILRKNGRNRSGVQNTQNGSSSSQGEGCGELENPAQFKEKLSGSNISGYGEGGSERPFERSRERGERGERGFDRGDRGERRFDRGERGFNRGDRREKRFDRRPEGETAEGVAESKDAPEASAEAEVQAEAHNGPSFESKEFTPRAIEVGLSDRRPKFHDSNPSEKGVVSYTPEDDVCPSISLFSRIKTAIKSLFGGKKSKNERFDNKRGGKKNWKNNREGGKHFNNNRRYDKRFNNNRRYNNDRRPNNGGRPQGGDSQQG